MPGSGQETTLGPFIGGLNTRGDSTAIADNELAECLNMEVDVDGSLRVRPQITLNGNVVGSSGDAQGLGWFNILGVKYFVAQAPGGTYRLFGGSWFLISSAIQAAAAVQYNGLLWLIASPASGQQSGYWDGATFTPVANMPKGTCAAVYKGLIYIGANLSGSPAVATKSRLYYSNALTAGTFWPASPNALDIGYGDGEDLVQLVPWQGSLLCFRTGSIWTYNWASTPAGFQISPLDSTVGIYSGNAVDTLEGAIYFTQGARAYRLVNGRVEVLNEHVLFNQFSSTSTTNGFDAVSIFGNRVVFSILDYMYVYSTDTYSWSRWQSTRHMGKTFRYDGNYPGMIGFGRTSGNTRQLFSSGDDFFGGNGETITATIRTKTFDFGAPGVYKRLFWWGAFTNVQYSVTGSVTPVAFPQSGGDFSGVGTPIVSTVTPPITLFTLPLRTFIKFPQSLRFRGVYFEVSFTLSRSISSGVPTAKVYTLTTFSRIGERAVKTLT